MSVERLGRFELVSHLASGGMAKVFLARVAGLAGFERHVVLKTLRKEDIPDESYVGMFLDEARLAASLHHQHVAQVYDVGCTSDGTYFLAMEYIHGKTVRSVLETVDDRRLWMPLDFGLSVVTAAAAGLHHAHERCRSDGTPLHIVHRDVSPSNVLVSYDGSIKLIDFGIAKATARVTQTRTGFIKGKAGYMAPEQARGYAVDRRSDVFSLGVLAYELTTQHRAFDAPTEFERVEKIVHGDIVPPSHWVPDFPAELEATILTALALDPDERYQTADEMRVAIESVAKSENLILGSAPIARLLAMLYGQPLEPWIAPPSHVAKGSGSHDSLVFVPDIPHSIDESSDITKPLDRELTEAEAIVEDLAERHAAVQRHLAAREAANAEIDARSTLSLRGQLPRAGTIKPAPPFRAPTGTSPPPLPAVMTSPSSRNIDTVAGDEAAAARAIATTDEPSSPHIEIEPPRDVLSARAPSPSSASPSSANEPSSKPRSTTTGSQPPPIPSRSRPMPATQPPPIPAAAISRSMPVASPDDPPPFIAQPIAPLTLDDEPNERVPLLIAVDTPSTPISNFAAPPVSPLAPTVPSVTIQPRKRKAKSPTPSGTATHGGSKLRRQILTIIACGAALGLAAGATITVLSNETDGAPPTTAAPVASKAVESKPVAAKPVAAKPVVSKPAASKPVASTPVASKAIETKPETKPVETKPVETKPVETKPVETPKPSSHSMATAPITPPDLIEPTPSPVVEAQPAVTEVTITVVTDPPGATVVLDGVRLGTTPYTGTVPAQKREGWLKVRKRDHIAVKTRVDRATDIRWNVKLDAKR